MYNFNRYRTVFDCPPNCPDRKPGCQDRCKTHAEQKARYEALKAAERGKVEAGRYVSEQVGKSRDAAVKRQQKYSLYKHRTS